MNDAKRDARLDLARELAKTAETDEDWYKLRVMAGTASRLYRKGWTFWNWLFNTEYNSMSFPPIAWLTAGVFALVVIGLIIFILITGYTGE